jgi:alpha-beta hydrolase superfamily lysophospholipase
METDLIKARSGKLSGLAWFLIAIGIGGVALGLYTSISLLIVIGAICLGGALAEVFIRASGGWKTVKKVLLGVVGGVAAVLMSAAVGAWLYVRPTQPDAFYDPPAEIPGEPGVLLRSEPTTRDVPEGARGWRILYTTTDHLGKPTVASGLILAPVDPGVGPRPVIAWTHGTTGADPACAPSVLGDPYPFDPTIPALDQVMANGWIFVATDYAGLGTPGPHPYLIGEGEGRSALDSVRAARQINELNMEDRTVVWGHSQGGHAALWTGILAPSYAPDVNVIGVAALAPASNIIGLVEGVKDTPVGKIITSFFLRAYTEAYPELRFDEMVNRSARWITRDVAKRCLAGPGALASIVQVTRLLNGPIWAKNPSEFEALAKRIEENTPRRPIEAPLLIAQGTIDDLVLPSVQEAYISDRCAAGQSLEFRTYEGKDHLSVVAPESLLNDDLIAWTKDRLAGQPQAPGCERITR